MKKFAILLESKAVNVNVNILRLQCLKRVYKWVPANLLLGIPG